MTLSQDWTDSLSINPRTETVLIADNEDLNRGNVALAVGDAGYSVILAKDGIQALELARKPGNVDLIVLDLMLPHMNGLDLCRLLRVEGNSVPIVMMAAMGSEIDPVVALEMGADDYLVKPFGMRELIARCRAILRRHSRQKTVDNTQVLRWGDLWMHPQEGQVMVNEKNVELSRKELDLLEFFMRNPRQVWSREQLIEHVWGLDFTGVDKTVDVHISQLRKKLEKDPSQPQYLMTVRGFGYRFSAAQKGNDCSRVCAIPFHR